MQTLIRLNDPLSVQALGDALQARRIGYRVDNAGMNALMPLPDVMDMRVFVDDSDMAEARLVLQDLGLGDGDA